MKVAVLTNEAYKGGTTLEESEHKLLWSVLKLSRLEDEKASILLQAIGCCADPEFVKAYGGIYELFFTKLMEESGRHHDSIKGVLYLRKAGATPVTLLDQDDWDTRALGCLEALMTLLQRGGWLANWLELVLPRFVKEKPTPLDVIDVLTEPAANFESDIEDAQRMFRDWPELVQPEAQGVQ
jgi:hypothetical protein